MERRKGFSPSLTQKTGNDIILSQIIDIKYLPLYKISMKGINVTNIL